MLKRRLSYTDAIQNGLPEDYSDADYMASSLPLNHGIFPTFQVIAIPINHTVGSRHFRSLVVIMELYEYRPTADIALSDLRLPSCKDIARLHYLYSLEAPDDLYGQGLRTVEVLNPTTTAYITWKTQFLGNEAEKQHFYAWGRAYRCFVPPEGTHDEFWQAFYERFERYYQEQIPVQDLTFEPINLASPSTEWHFRPTARPATDTADIIAEPATLHPVGSTAGIVQSLLHTPGGLNRAAASAPLGVTCYGHEFNTAITLPRTFFTAASLPIHLYRFVEYGRYGLAASDRVTYTTPVGLAANALGGVALLCEGMDIFNRIREGRMGETGSQLAALTFACRATAFSLWARAAAVGTLTAYGVAVNVDAAAAGLAVISDIYSLYDTNKTRKTMAECLAKLEVYFRQNNAGFFQEWVSSTQSDRTRITAQYHAGFISLYVMVAWLARKYKRCLKGTVISTGHDVAQLGLAITAAVVLAAGSVPTLGITIAISCALGLFYLGVSTGRAMKGNHNNATLLKNYKDSVEALHERHQISEEEYTQEQILFALAEKLHPIRHRLLGATMGDYMRVKIASFVLSTKRAVTETPDAFGPEHPQLEMLKLCADLMGAAIGYNAAKHGQFTTPAELRMHILRLGSNIPLRGY